MTNAPTPAGIYGIGFNHNGGGGGFADIRVDGKTYSADQVRKALAALAPVAAEGGERDEAFCEAYYDAHLNDAWKALREGKPFQINADGAISFIQQAASDRRALRTEPTGGGEGA